MNRFTLEMGDEIEVAGQRFVLVEVSRALDKPATVVFKQPIELVTKNAFERASGVNTEIVLVIHKKTHRRSPDSYSWSCLLCNFRIEGDLDRDYVEGQAVTHYVSGHNVPVYNIKVEYHHQERI